MRLNLPGDSSVGKTLLHALLAGQHAAGAAYRGKRFKSVKTEKDKRNGIAANVFRVRTRPLPPCRSTG